MDSRSARHTPAGTLGVGTQTIRIPIPKGYVGVVRQFIDKAMETIDVMVPAGVGAREEDAEYVLLVTPRTPGVGA